MEGNPICYFGETDARNRRVKFGIKANDRTRHMYVIGKTGMGKSTLLENMAIQDMQRGDGIAFIDPHGKTAELLLEYVPESRIKDVLYFAPFDLENPISFNVMEDVGPDKRHLVVSGLMSAFKKIWVDAWSARMEYILNNILLALLEYPGSTILGVNRILADKEYRKKVVDNVKDVSVKAFWLDEFAKYGDRYMQEAGAAIQNKVGQFVSNPLIRNIIGQPKSTFDLRQMMDQRKIIIVNLSKGRVGEQNANLLGSMFVTKLYLAAMSRADLSDSVLARFPPFYLFVDEFQSFANESFANILSEARKYHLSLTIAHQYIEQMSEEVRAAVFGNVGTMVVFRVGAYDAEVLEKEYAPRFTAEDIVNLGFAQVYLKLMIDGVTSPPFSATTLPPLEKPPVSFRDDVIEWTRRAYSRVRTDVEDTIRVWSENERHVDTPTDTKKKPVRPIDSRDQKSRFVAQDRRRPIPIDRYQETLVKRHGHEELLQVKKDALSQSRTPVESLQPIEKPLVPPTDEFLPLSVLQQGVHSTVVEAHQSSRRPLEPVPITSRVVERPPVSPPHFHRSNSDVQRSSNVINSNESKENSQQKAPVPPQRSGLRDALAAALKNASPVTSEKKPPFQKNNHTPENKANSFEKKEAKNNYPPIHNETVVSSRGTNEVSADEVRRVLDVPQVRE